LFLTIPPFSSTFAMEIVEEKVDITALLRGILNAYPGNSAILREYLQNSDDARAKKQVRPLSSVPALCVLRYNPDLRLG
jgi:hypothetical protein